MAVWTLKLKAPFALIEALTDEHMHAQDDRVYSVSVFEMDRRFSVLELLVDSQQTAKDLAAPFFDKDNVDVEIEQVPEDKDWVALSQSHLRPVRAGRFWVYGSHDKHKDPEAEIPILIDAGEAFGTGHHATTAGCLKAFGEYLEKTKPTSVLDLGCGAGTLAIAAAKILGLPVMASDIDAAAVRVTLENAQENEVGGLITAVESEGFADPALIGTFDLIFANIMAGPLIEMAPDIAAHTNDGGTIILSGLLESQTQKVLAAFGDAGFKLSRRNASEDWATLTLKKEGG